MNIKTIKIRGVALGLTSLFFGAVLPTAYAPFEQSFVAPLAMTGLFLLINFSKRGWDSFLICYAFGFAQFAVGISWVHVSIDNFGGLPLPVSLLLMALLSAYLALFSGAVGWLWHRICENKPAWLSILVFPSLWVMAEIARGEFLTGFPWLALGYSQTSSWLFAWAPIAGVMGISWLVAALGIILAQLIHKERLVWAIPSLFIIVGGTYAAYIQDWGEKTGKFANVALVQGNIKQSMKWDPNHLWPTMSKYQDMSRPYYERDLIIWPEAAVPDIELNAQDYLNNVNAAVALRGGALITGIIDFQPQSDAFFNNLIVLGNYTEEGEAGDYYYGSNNRYSKHHLLPIGEFVPFGDILRPIAPLFNLPMSSFSEGSYIQHNLRANGWRLAPAICYEILFAEQVRQNTHEETDFILTVSNDSWFGDSIGPHQHLQIAQMRAKELARPVIRATNSGLTAIIDANGEIIETAEQFADVVLTSQVDQYRGQTWFSQVGHIPVIVFSILMIVLGILIRDR